MTFTHARTHGNKKIEDKKYFYARIYTHRMSYSHILLNIYNNIIMLYNKTFLKTL